MAIVKWDPFNDFQPFFRRSLDPFDWLMDEDWSSSFPIDIYEEGKDVVVEADLPGFDKEEVEISVSEDAVTLSAERQVEEKSADEDRKYLRRERFYRRCARTISLPAPVKADAAEAVFEGGTLTLTLPKVEIEEPETVKIKVQDKKN